MGISMEAQKEAILEKSKKTMSVPEMRRLLGLKKTDSYWLVHRNFFQTYIVNGQMRVDIASFEKWYANQVKHKKVNGEEPGAELMKSSYSFRDAANLHGIFWKYHKRDHDRHREHHSGRIRRNDGGVSRHL